MKITFFIGSMGRGGAERVISILANHYAKMGWDVDIALLLDQEVGYELHDNVNIINLNAGPGSYIKNLPSWLTKVRKYIKTAKPERIVSFVGRINMLVLTAALGLKAPIVVSERNDPKHDGRGKLIQTYCNLIYHNAAAVVYQTKYEQSCFSSSLKNGYIIPNPVSVHVTKSLGQNTEIVTAGRLLPQKNQKMLISAFAQVHKNHPEMTLKIFGSGNLKDELQEQIEILGLQKCAFLCGNILDLHNHLSGAKMFVMTSEFEGLSNALIEAMMLGLPCITTDYPGADELIFHGENGLMVPCRDTEALAKAMERIIEDPIFSENLSRSAMKNSENYYEDIVLRMWDEIIIGKS